MERRDYLKDQIDQMGRVLGKILADFLGLKSQGMVNQGIEISNEQLIGELDLDVEELLSLNKSDMIEQLEAKNLTAEHLEILASYLHEVGEVEFHHKNEHAKTYLNAALTLLDHLDEGSRTYSIERSNRRSNIKDMLH